MVFVYECKKWVCYKIAVVNFGWDVVDSCMMGFCTHLLLKVMLDFILIVL